MTNETHATAAERIDRYTQLPTNHSEPSIIFIITISRNILFIIFQYILAPSKEQDDRDGSSTAGDRGHMPQTLKDQGLFF